ncbi:uncharacterized protein LOC132193001 [Neocloeon triangulifer]|uniref:uncharacterized protein LOC132193001 n=1 Tax=Neocloeon triangulifer TaxID=2078957 RepID=UPI00286F825E|nr:uncharacterized protein LOC132193001 [Neocloeon triangulifer]
MLCKAAVCVLAAVLLSSGLISGGIAEKSENEKQKSEAPKKAIEIVPVTEPVIFGEGPHWSPIHNCLYFIDIDAGIVLKYNATDEAFSRIFITPGNNPVTFIIPTIENENEFAISRGREVLLIRIDNLNVATIIRSVATVELNLPDNRFNEARADATGRLWAGTVGPEGPNGEIPAGGDGSLYRLNENSTFTQVESNIDVSNGIAWSLNNSLMYYIDTGTFGVDVFDYNIETGIADNKRKFFDFIANNVSGVPDSMSIDSEGNLWVTCYAGSQVIQISPDGELLQSIQLPVALVTSAVWGGPNFDVLYVTTSRHRLTDEELAQQPLAGCVFKVTGLGVTGLAAQNVKLPPIFNYNKIQKTDAHLKAIEIVPVTEPVIFGEGPHWSPIHNCLYFIDIDAGIVLKYNASDEVFSRIFIPPGDNPVTFIIPTVDNENEFAISRRREVLLVGIDDLNVATIIRSIASVENNLPENRFNEARADARGRLWAGTVGPEGPTGEIPPGQGSLYRLNENSTFSQVDSNIDVSNGISWSLDNTLMYYIDTGTLGVDVFDYDISTGDASNRRTFFDFTANNVTGIPDSMSIDSEGNLWVASYFGSQVIQINPEGQLLQSIQFPVTLVTSAVWGGPNFDVLYVTTSRHRLTDEELTQQPLAGCVFKVTGLGVIGLPAQNVKLPPIQP